MTRVVRYSSQDGCLDEDAVMSLFSDEPGACVFVLDAPPCLEEVVRSCLAGRPQDALDPLIGGARSLLEWLAPGSEIGVGTTEEHDLSGRQAWRTVCHTALIWTEDEPSIEATVAVLDDHHPRDGGWTVEVRFPELTWPDGTPGVLSLRTSLGQGLAVQADGLAEDGLLGLIKRLGRAFGYEPDLERALLHGAYSGHLGLVKGLLRAGVDVNARDPFGETPLSRAVSGGRLPVMRELLRRGADVEAGNIRDRTSLMIAASTWSETTGIDIVRELLEADADPDRRDCRGKTAIMYAIERGNPRLSADIISALIEAGADTGLKDRDGSAAFDLAVRCDLGEAVRALLS